ncbi:MAG: protein-disulfide reductase DsbD [Methylococcaceae bacterium]|nr:protein-disulfide reductase DsbD [Methylococcaceae bacterium]MDP3018096.1 protein-disulfide reductase DsbD [Methylococcaceae bacterium]MDP3934514.1 protein-disulfide reductase DsbD [Methylococcaceae bacterium]MDZ4155304.1 protein-disulfide reductase DsbD [Methylococcales bacterium]
MPFVKLIFLTLLFFVGAANALDKNEPLPPDEAFKISVKAISDTQLEVSWGITEGYYLYRDKLRFESKTAQIPTVTPELPAGQTKHDEFFGDMVIYRNKLIVPLTIANASSATSLQLFVQYQGCADQGICYPPQKKTLDITLPASVSSSPVAASADPLAQLVKNAAALKLNLFEDELLTAEQAFEFFATVKDANSLHLSWKIAPGYYLYREKVQLALVDAQSVQLGAYNIPHGTPKQDEAFGKVEVFHDELDVDVALNRTDSAAQIINLQAKFQGCADRGVCYPPITQNVSLSLPQTIAVSPSINPAAPLSEQDQIAKSLHQDSLALTLLSFLGFGLLLAFTPCIFPMIPILSGIIVGHGHKVTTGRAFMLSLGYVLASAAAYTVFGVLAALFGSNLQATFQQPWIIAVFSSIFIVLALSMFDFYQLQLPDAIRAKLHNSSEKHRDGSMWGAITMGALSSLIVGPCVAAPLAGALIYIGQTGDAVLGGSALFAMGLGMGLPLLLLGASAGKLLPKAGNWLNATKVVFGVMMLAMAVWMLSRILPATVTMMLWAMLLILPAIYLSAIDPLPEGSSGWRKLWKGLGLMMLAYGLLLLIGVSMGNNNPLKPLQGFSVNGQNPVADSKIAFAKVTSVADLTNKIQQANANNQPVMLDFYADWCISCKEMENYTFADSSVKEALANFVVLQADVTNNTDDDQALLAHFNLVGPPGVLFFGLDSQEKTAHRVIGYQDAQTFIQTLLRIK